MRQLTTYHICVSLLLGSQFLPRILAGIEGTKPHIIIILADDLGFNDVGYNAVGSEILTPNIDSLASEGVKLDNYYVLPQCTPTRGTLLTGRYQIHTGLQHNVITSTRPMCLPLTETTMAEKLKEAGYATHLVGKWHLGMWKYECTPLYRGFDSFLGIYQSGGDYYTHMHDFVSESIGIDTTGYDFRDGNDVDWSNEGTYSTYAYDERAQEIIRSHNQSEPMFLLVSMQAPHSPLEVDDTYKQLYRQTIKGLPNRKTLAGMISCMDEAIGNIVDTLKETGLYDNSVILFSSDNGAPTSYGSNWPLRGAKNTLFEGGIRSVGFVHSPLLPSNVQQTTSKALIHVSDWFPTFVDTLAGENVSDLDVDGVSVWSTIFDGTDSDRTEILHNIDHLASTNADPDTVNSFDTSIHAALTKGDWKIITGLPGDDWDWTAPPESDLASISKTDDSSKHLWLFNITGDPYETTDLSTIYPDVVDELLDRLAYYYDGYVTPVWPNRDISYDPANYGGVWEPWG